MQKIEPDQGGDGTVVALVGVGLGSAYEVAFDKKTVPVNSPYGGDVLTVQSPSGLQGKVTLTVSLLDGPAIQAGTYTYTP